MGFFFRDAFRQNLTILTRDQETPEYVMGPEKGEETEVTEKYVQHKGVSLGYRY